MEEIDCQESGRGEQDDTMHQGVLSSVVVSSSSNKLSMTSKTYLGMEFNSIEDAAKFYKKYSQVMGFGIRTRDTRRSSDDLILMRKWVCSKEGSRDPKYLEKMERKREPKAITRVNCNAAFKVNFKIKTRKWCVTKFVAEHTHELANPMSVPFINSHRSLNSLGKAQVQEMFGNNSCPSQNMDLTGRQSEDHSFVGLVENDLNNSHIDSIRKEEIRDDHIDSVLGYFSAKKASDPSFFYKYTLDDKKRIANLFWSDGTSRSDYACFGDVLAFDATYKTNLYQKPLIIFTGVNNHQMKTIFAAGMLVDETVETYIWALKTLLEAMDYKKPTSVVTDGDKVMKRAIKNVFPGARHRLCVLHLQRIATSNVHVKGFTGDFKKFMHSRYTPEEFDSEWKRLVDNYELHQNEWIAKMYRKRLTWAECFLRGHFFGGLQSTHSTYMKHLLEEKMNLFELLCHFDGAVQRIRHKEAKAEYVSTYTAPVLSDALHSIESHGAEFLTRKVFFIFREELRNQNLQIVVGKQDYDGRRIYTQCTYGIPDKIRILSFDVEDASVKCPCMMFESCSIPCCHMISVLKFEHIDRLPESWLQIMNRWSKKLKVDMQFGAQREMSDDGLCNTRDTTLFSVSNQTRKSGDQTESEVGSSTSKIVDEDESYHTKKKPKYSQNVGVRYTQRSK